jgi:RHS repeat-associated protein
MAEALHFLHWILTKPEEGYALDTSDKKRYRFTPFNGDKENQLLASLSQTTSGAAIRFFYNEKAQLHHIIDSGNRPIHITYTDEGRIHQIYLPEPESNVTRDHTKPTFFCVVEHHYRNGMLVRVDDALQQALQYHYDNKLLIKETFRSGLSFYFEYDGRDHNARCLRTWGDEGIYYRDIRYDTENNITWVKNSLGHVTTYYHNGVLPHKVVDPLGYVSHTEYNEYSEIVCETNELGFKTRYEFDGHGNTIKIIGADGSTIQLLFDQKQNLIELVNQMGHRWCYVYDNLNRLILKINPLRHTVQYNYHNSFLSSIIDPTGNQLHFIYDQNNNLRSLSDGKSVQLTLEYDSLGNLLASTDKRGNCRRLHYDKRFRVRKIEEPDGNNRFFTYDDADNIIRSKDEYNDISFTYSGIGRLVTRTQANTTIKFEYNREEQLTAILNEGNRIYNFEYDACGEIISESGFDGVTREFLLDPLGRITRINRCGSYSLYQYNTNNQVTHVIHSDGSHEYFEYRKDGEITRAANNTISLKFERDELGRLTKEHQGDYWVASEYDKLGYRTRIQSSFGFDQRITRNQRSEVVKISTDTAYEVDFKRDANGLEIERSLPGGIQSRWSRDKLGRPIQHEINRGATTLGSKTYVWGLNNRLFKLIDSFNQETIYQYDPFGNLLSARYSDGNFDLRMPDAVNNLFKTHSQKDREYGPAGQLLAVHTSKGTTRYHYDAEGKLITKIEPGEKLWRYEWNGSGMMVKVIRPDGKTVEFEYDPLGRRTRKIFDKKMTHWIWDDNNPLHEWVEYKTNISATASHKQLKTKADDIAVNHRLASLQQIEPQGPPCITEGTKKKPVTWLFDPDSFSPMAKLVGDERYSIITDHLGTPMIMFDDKGQQVWSSEVNIWGRIRKLRGEKDFCPFKFAGQYEDSETELYYNRFRYYDPEAGQYLSQDPIGLRGGIKPYAYVCDTNTQIDSFGLEPWKLDPAKDLDWSAGDKTYREALDKAFELTGVPKDEFVPTAWAKSIYGKTVPVEWQAPGGAIVNVDDPTIIPSGEGPQKPHVGYQSPGKRGRGGRQRGHILLPSVPATRGSLRDKKGACIG